MIDFKTTIGLEVHVQLKTKSKMFCGCDNKADEAAPNTLVCPVCLGLPGVLPVANRQAIEWVLKTGLALNCQLAKESRFDRKHYFYPDLPKNYQISQFDKPFVEGGYLEIATAEGQKKIALKRIHLEEDAGKLIHTDEATLIDLNRAGTPLMEIVTEPEISSPQEAKAFMQELRAILRALDVSDANMEKGHLRCDANISLRECKMQNAECKMGIPVEIKNLNSFRMVERALQYEEKRQQKLLERGEKVLKETRGWNDNKGETYSQRSKEIAQDYRYFPEPDLPPFTLQGFDIEKIKKEIPELPAAKRARFMKMDLKISDAVILAAEKPVAAYFEAVSRDANPVLAASIIINDLKIDKIDTIPPTELRVLIKAIAAGDVLRSQTKSIIARLQNGQTAADVLSAEKGGTMAEAELEKIIQTVLNENSGALEDIRRGKNEAIGFLVGQVMKKTQGKANPEAITQKIKAKLT